MEEGALSIFKIPVVTNPHVLATSLAENHESGI